MEKYYTAGYIKDTDFCFEMLTEYKKADTLTAEQKKPPHGNSDEFSGKRAVCRWTS